MIEKIEIPKRMDEYGHWYQEANSIEFKINELIEWANKQEENDIIWKRTTMELERRLEKRVELLETN